MKYFKERSALAIAKAEREGRDVTPGAILDYYPQTGNGSNSDIKGQHFFRAHSYYYWNKWLEQKVGITFTQGERATEAQKKGAKMALERFAHFGKDWVEH